MSDSRTPATRRTVLLGAALLTGASSLLAAGAASAAGTLPKANAKYQETPKGAQQCDNCTYYIAGKPNMCKVVAGEVSPKAWCMMWAPKR